MRPDERIAPALEFLCLVAVLLLALAIAFFAWCVLSSNPIALRLR